MEKATSVPASYCGFQRKGIWNVMAHSIFVLLTICCKINKALTFKSQPPPHPTPAFVCKSPIHSQDTMRNHSIVHI